MKDPRKILLIFAGTFSVVLAVIGMFVPVLPTTPFLLLAGYCYARSSRRYYQWLITNRWFGKYLRNYREGKGISLRHKVFTLVLLWLMILCTSLFFVSQGWIRLILLGIAVGVTIHVAGIKTQRSELPKGTMNNTPPDRGY